MSAAGYKLTITDLLAVALDATTDAVVLTISDAGVPGPAVPLVQTISVVSPSATSAPSEAAAAAALAENKIWTDEITGARMKPYLTAGKLRWRAVTTLLLCLCSLGARADQEAVSVDSATRQTAQDVDFAGRITVPTPTSASQVATKGSSETAAATAAASAQAAAIAASDPAGTAAAALEVHNTATSGAHTSLLAGKLNTFTGSSGNLLVAAGFEGGLSVSSIHQNSLVLTSTLTNTLLGYSSTSHSHTYGSLSGTPISWDWGALVNIPTSFAPTAHALTHSSTGGDAITPASIGAQPAGDYVITPTFTGHTTLTGSNAHGITPASIGAIPDTTKELVVTYTGDLAVPISFATGTSYGMVGFDSTAGTNTYTTTNGISITGFRYDEGAQSTGKNVRTLSFDNLQACSGGIADFTSFAGFSIYIVNCPYVTEIRFPELVFTYEKIQMAATPSCLVYSFPKLKTAGGLSLNPTLIRADQTVTVDLSELETVNGAFTFGSARFGALFELPKLKFVAGTFGINPLIGATAISLPELTDARSQMSVSSVTATSFSMPKLVSMGTSFSLTTTGLTTLTLSPPGTLKKLGGSVSITGAKLNAASVDSLMAVIASLDGTNGTTRYGTGSIISIASGTSATPTFTGTSKTSTAITTATPTDSYRVSTTCVPDNAGVYTYSGTLNGQSMYRSEFSDYSIWYDSSLSKWTISAVAGTLGENFWQSGTITGTYALGSGAGSGTPYVATHSKATVTLAGHGFSDGDLVTITSASPAALQGTYAITVTSTSSFWYNCATSTNATVQGSFKWTSSTTEGFYNKQKIARRGATVTTN